MYTSGCPNSQNRCCHSTGLPPAATSKKCVPNSRSNSSSTRPIVITGRLKASRSCTTSPIHTNTGIRNSVMPGARMFSTVTARFTAETVDAIPAISSPIA